MEENRNLKLIKRLEERTGKVYLGTEVDREIWCSGEDEEDFPANFIRSFFVKEIEEAQWEDRPNRPLWITKHTRLRYLPDLESIRPEKILIRMHLNSHPPRTISDIARMIGLTHSSRIWGLNDGIDSVPEDDYYFDMFFEDDYRIACAEDVYDYLIGRGVRDYRAEEVAEYISLSGWSGNLTGGLKSYGCEEWFIDVVERVSSLLSRAECYQRAIETKRLIYYLSRYPDIYVSVYEELFGTCEDR